MNRGRALACNGWGTGRAAGTMDERFPERAMRPEAEDRIMELPVLIERLVNGAGYAARLGTQDNATDGGKTGLVSPNCSDVIALETVAAVTDFHAQRAGSSTPWRGDEHVRAVGLHRSRAFVRGSSVRIGLRAVGRPIREC